MGNMEEERQRVQNTAKGSRPHAFFILPEIKAALWIYSPRIIWGESRELVMILSYLKMHEIPILLQVIET